LGKEIYIIGAILAVSLISFSLFSNEVFAEEISDAITNLFSYDVQTGELAIMWLVNQKGLYV